MSNVVQFLEALARNTKPLSAGELEIAVARAELEPAAQRALLAGDHDGLIHALNGRVNVMCLVIPAENDEPQEEEQEGDGEAPEQEASSKAA